MPLVKVETRTGVRNPDIEVVYSVSKRRYQGPFTCTVNITTLIALHPPDPYRFLGYYRDEHWNERYAGVETDTVVVFRKRGREVSQWWIWGWVRGRWEAVAWESIRTTQQIAIAGRFCKKFGALKGMRPWGEEIEVLIALESL